MIRQLFKNKLFLLGFIFIIVVLASSFIYTFLLKDMVTLKTSILFDSSKKLIGRAPFPPSARFPLGTDDAGNNMLYLILDGAKFTILFALSVAMLRVVIGGALGIFRAMFGVKFTSTPSNFFQSLQTVPVALLLYFILQPVIYDTDKVVNYQKVINYAGSLQGLPPSFSTTQTVIFEVVVLTLIAIPTVSRLVGNETQLILRNEFIESAQTLGGSKWHLLKRHIFPHLFPKILIVFIQQMVQALLIIMHLGILQLFFGGTKVVVYHIETTIDPKTFEWSALIGDRFDKLGVTPWVPLAPIIMFTLSILALNFMLEGMKEVFTNYRPNKKKSEKKNAGQKRILRPSDPGAFQFTSVKMKEGSG